MREISVPHLRDLHAITVGGRIPLHASSSGLVLLAYGSLELEQRILAAPMPRFTDSTSSTPDALRQVLHAIRAEGFLVGHVHADARGIAVPIFGASNAVVAAVSAVVPNDDQPWVAVVRALETTAERVREALQQAYPPASDPRAAPVGDCARGSTRRLARWRI